jgi:Concanavalin A-like lectin/glucanases superfamily
MNLPSRPEFSWTPVADATTRVVRYTLTVDGSAVRELTPGECGPEQCVASPAGGLAPGAHAWAVEVTDATGNTASSAARSFEVDSMPPAAPTLTAPADGALVVSRRPTLSWNAATDAGSGIDRYEVWMDGARVAELPPAATSHTPAADLAAGQHSWHVTAVDRAGNAAQSATRRFTVEAFELLVSTRSDRAGAVPLDGESVRGRIYAFTAPDANVDQVTFWVDNPARTGRAFRSEGNAPFDLAGGDLAVANPYDTTRLTEGQHTITAALKKMDGTTVVVHAVMEVDNVAPTLTLAPSSVALATPHDGPVASASVDLGAGGGTPAYQTSTDAPWLSVSPAAGIAPAALTVLADPAGLDPGTYTGRVTATSGGHVPATLTVTFTVRPPPGESPYASAIAATPGVAGFWRLDETAGTGAADALGSNPGTFENGVVLGRPGALLGETRNLAAAFDGSNDQLRVPDHATLDTGDSFTLEAWVRRSVTSSSKVYRVLSKGEGNYAFGFANNFLSLRRQGSVDVARSLSTLTDTSGWHHIAATKNGAAVRLYLNGADVTNTSSIPSSVPAMANTSSDLIIGRASNATAGFPGSIDEAAVYSRALSAAEILSHYRASGR